jgi:hypothetical protein
LFTRASIGRSGASKQLAPQRWPHPGRIIFSKTIEAGLGSVAARAAGEVLSYLFLKDHNAGLNSSCRQAAVWE